MSASALGPVVGPVVRPKLPHAHAGQGFDRLAAIRGDAARLPVGDGLRALLEGRSQGARRHPLGDSLKSSFVVHPPILNDSFRSCQQFVWTPPDTPAVQKTTEPKEPAPKADPAWERVSAELTRRGKKIGWLATKLETSIQRVQNWSARGLPPKAYAEVAAALDESVDWVAGVGPPKWRTPPLAPTERDLLTEKAVAVGRAFDRMNATDQQLFLRLLEASFGAPPDARPKELGHSDFMDIHLEAKDDQQRRKKEK